MIIDNINAKHPLPKTLITIMNLALYGLLAESERDHMLENESMPKALDST